MNDYNSIPSTSPQSAVPMPFDMDMPPLNQSFSLGEKGKKHKKHKKKDKKREMTKELEEKDHRCEELERMVAKMCYTTGQLKHENDMLRRMSALAVAASQGRLDENVIETAFKILGK